SDTATHFPLCLLALFLPTPRPPRSTLFPYTTLFRSGMAALLLQALNPYMMRVFYNATQSHGDAAGRDERTGRYFETVIFGDRARSEEHTSELQSRENLVCRLLLEKKNNEHDKPEQSD